MKRLTLWISLVLVGFVVALAILALVWTPHDPSSVTFQRLLPPGGAHLLGTDGMGHDIASRIMVGAKMCLLVGVVAVAIAAGIGVPLGVLAGMTQRWWLRELILRTADVLYAFPALLLAILLAAAVGGSTWTAMAAVGVATIPAFVRIARAGTLQVMSQDYIPAARVSGTPTPVIAVRHVLPNVAALIGVQASVSFSIAILAEAGLSYLGLGTPATTPTWGRMLRDAQNQIFNDPIQAFWPGLAIAVAVLGFNLLGDALRDYLDPKLREVS